MIYIINDVTHESLFHALQKRKTPVPPGTALPSHEAASPTEVPKAPSFHGRDAERRDLAGVNSPASRNASARGRVRAQPLSASRGDDAGTPPRSGHAKQSQISLGSDRSEIRSLDELFSKAADGEDSASSSSGGELVLRYCLGRLGADGTNNLLTNLLIIRGRYSL